MSWVSFRHTVCQFAYLFPTHFAPLFSLSFLCMRRTSFSKSEPSRLFRRSNIRAENSIGRWGSVSIEMTHHFEESRSILGSIKRVWRQYYGRLKNFNQLQRILKVLTNVARVHRSFTKSFWKFVFSVLQGEKRGSTGRATGAIFPLREKRSLNWKCAEKVDYRDNSMS